MTASAVYHNAAAAAAASAAATAHVDPSAGERASAVAAAPSLLQLEELDSLLQEHQKLLRERVEKLREEKAKQHDEWYDHIQTLLPTPQKSAKTGGGPPSSPPAAGASPSKVPLVGSSGAPHASSAMPPLVDAISPPRPSRGLSLIHI